MGGYLIDQFLCETSNKRPETSKYAGTSLQTRSQFLKEVLTNVTEEVGSECVGMRISPLNSYQDMNRGDKAVEEVKFLSSMANDFDLAYLHVMRSDFFGVQKADVVTWARETFKNTLVVNMGFDGKEAREGIESGKFDAVAFGTKFLANPDLPRRISNGAELNAPKAELFYTDGVQGTQIILTSTRTRKNKNKTRASSGPLRRLLKNANVQKLNHSICLSP